MSVTCKAINANPVVNNGGLVIDSSSTNLIAVGTKEQNSPSSATATSGTVKAVNAGNYCQINQFILKGVGATTALATVAYAGAGAGNPIPQVSQKIINSRRSVHITSWSYSTGIATKTANTVDSFGTDFVPTRAVPGELVYTTGAKLPKMDDYKAITGS